MTQSDLHRAVARSTGDDISIIAARGFFLVESFAEDDSDLDAYLDWDVVDAERNVALFPNRSA
jgi:hypothetical protein